MASGDPPVEPDLNFLARFLHPSQYLEFRLKEEGAESLTDRFFTNDLAEVSKKITDDNLHAWFGVANRQTPESGDEANLGFAHFLYSDLDGIGIDDALNAIVREAELPVPTMMVNSGHGVHPYWEIEPLDLSKEENLERFKRAERAILAAVGGDERAKDAARVLRVPGTWNPKPPRAYSRVAKRGREIYSIDAFDPGTGHDKLVWVWKHTKVHALALGIAGWCYHKGVQQEEAESLISEVASESHDPEIHDRLRCVRDAYEGGASGKEIAYKPHLDSPMGKMVLEALQELWGKRPEGGPLIPKVEGKEYFQPTSSGVDHIRRMISKQGETWIRTHVLSVDLRYTAAFEVEHAFAVNAQYHDRMGMVNQVVNFADLPGFLRQQGVVMAQNHLEDALGALRFYHINNGIQIAKTHPGTGVYHDGNHFQLVLEDAIPLTTPQDMMKTAILRRGARLSKKSIKAYTDIRGFFGESEILPLMGLCAIAPFLFALKEGELVDMIPYIFLRGPNGLGKTTLNGIFTSDFYGTQRITGDAFGGRRTGFRVDDYLNATTFPIHIEEAEDITFNEQAPKLKAAAESAFLSSKGKPSRQQDIYLARATLFFDGNEFPIEDWNLMVRFIVILMDEGLRAGRVARQEDFRKAYAKLEPVGRAFVEHIVSWMNESADAGGTTAVALLADTVEKYRKAFAGLDYPDTRRATLWAIIYTGLRLWEKVCKDHKIPFSITEDDFRKEVIVPLEGTLVEERPPLLGNRFRQWWVGVLVSGTYMVRRDGIDIKIVRGEGEYFVQDDDYWYITQDALERFRDGSFNLIDIARELVQSFGGKVEAYYTRTRFREMGDGKQHRVLRLPKAPFPQEGPIESFGEQDTFTDEIEQARLIREYMESHKGEWVDPGDVAESTGIKTAQSWLRRLANEGDFEVRQGLYKTAGRGPMEKAMAYARGIRRNHPRKPASFVVQDLMSEFSDLSREEAEGIVFPLFEAKEIDDEGERED